MLCPVQEWWDSSEAAGPRIRPGAAFDQEPPTLEVLRLEGATLKFLGCVKKRGRANREQTIKLQHDGNNRVDHHTKQKMESTHCTILGNTNGNMFTTRQEPTWNQCGAAMVPT